MRLLAITNMYPSAAFPGHGTFVRDQIESLAAAGLGVRVLFIDRRREGPWAYYRMEPRIADAVAEFDPDVIHVMYGGVMACQVVRRRPVCPVVVTFHGSDLLGENLSGWTRKIISRYGVQCSRRAARKAQGVVVVARRLVRALRAAAPPEKIRVIPCGIDLERFKPMDTDRCRRRLGWSSESFHVLFASSNQDPVKRPWLAKAAVEQTLRQGIPVELHLLTGVPHAEVPNWLNASDALLLTSTHEGSPTIVKEALACGTPVVSVDVGDAADMIEGIEGCHLADAEPRHLAEKLRLVRQRHGRIECPSRLAELSVESLAGKLKQFYEDVVGSGLRSAKLKEDANWLRDGRPSVQADSRLPASDTS